MRFCPERIARRRRELGMTQLKLAAMSGLSNVTISMIEAGRKEPRARTLGRLAEALKSEVGYFFSQPANNS